METTNIETPSPALDAVREPLVRRLLNRRFMATGLAAVALAGFTSEAAAQAPDADPSQAPITNCIYNLLDGPKTDCTNPDIPMSCVPEHSFGQLDQYGFELYKKNMGDKIAAEFPLAEARFGTKLVGIQDDGRIVNNDLKTADAGLLLGRNLGANWFRIVITPYRFDDERDRQRVDTAIQAARSCGYKVIELTIAFNRRHWTDKTASSYVSQVGSRYQSQSLEYHDIVYTVNNEPNLGAEEGMWQYRMKGLTQSQTARHLNQLSYTILKGYDPSAPVWGGSISSLAYPAKFIEAMSQPGPGEAPGTPLLMDGLAYHPYDGSYALRYGVDPDSPVNSSSKVIGIRHINFITNLVGRLHAEGKLQTSTGKKPKVYLDEYNETTLSEAAKEQSDAAHIASLNPTIPSDGQRARLYIENWQEDICNSEGIGGLLLYKQQSEGAASHHDAPETDTALITPNFSSTNATKNVKFKLTSTYYGMQSYIARNPQCFEGDGAVASVMAP
jgi:hypothetical protein